MEGRKIQGSAPSDRVGRSSPPTSEANGRPEGWGSVAATDGDAPLPERYRRIRRNTERLTEGLAPEDTVVQTMEDVSPTKWHLAHTSWFWECFVLRPHLDGYVPFDSRYHYLFNSYYVQAGERHCRARRGYISRPTLEAVEEYRRHVDDAMDRVLASSVADPGSEVAWLVELGLNHEEQHQELMLTDIKHVFSVNPLRPPFPPAAGRASDGGPELRLEPRAPDPRWVEFDEGVYEIGWEGPGFHYDNEAPRHRRFLEPFALSERLVTNAEYLAFMEDGGYGRPELWMSEGWAAREAADWTEPFYWEERGGEWWAYTLGGMQPVDPDEPVCHLTWFEADAFARWAGARLPGEDEWEVAAKEVPIRGNFAAGNRFHPVPAPEVLTREVPSSREKRLKQMFGDVWEWTGSQYRPYPGFRPAKGAVGEYNGKFMSNQFVLRGGSSATPPGHIRVTYRNFFPPDAAWQFTGLRLATDRATTAGNR